MTGVSKPRRRDGSEVGVQDSENRTIENAPGLPRLFSPETVANAFELPSTNWLVEAARDQRIPHTRLGRRLRFTVEQVERAIELHRVEEAIKLHSVEQATPQQSQRHRPSGRSTEDMAQPRRLRPRVPSRMRNATAS